MSALTQNTSTAKYAATDAPRSTCQRVCAPICVSLLGGPEGQVVPSEGFLHTLSLRRKVVSVKACPPTYTTMFVTVDSLGRPMDPPRPAGYVDPYILHLGRPQFDGPGHAYVYARQVQEHPARLSYAWWAEPDGASSAVLEHPFCTHWCSFWRTRPSSPELCPKESGLSNATRLDDEAGPLT